MLNEGDFTLIDDISWKNKFHKFRKNSYFMASDKVTSVVPL